jgi:UDP-N-acetyl-D-galactosamine dehydrogenase
MRPLRLACNDIGKIIKEGDIVIFESTVYPGTTEELCGPIIERVSNLKKDKDFFLGYSPERINPGDSERRITEIIKVTSGSTSEIADLVDHLYSKIITAGTYKAPSIKVAEAAKVIENTQRDLNIALINELSKIFSLLEVDTQEVLKAAETKWNFIPMRPGLVGGHCIGVDPYYLTYKAQELGYHPEVILSGRKLNNSMGPYVAERCLELMSAREKNISASKVLIMGYTFKENCPDIRNTRVIDIIDRLRNFCEIELYDPWVIMDDLEDDYVKPMIITELIEDRYDAIIIAVSHDIFKNLKPKKIRQLAKKNSPVLDLKGIFNPSFSDFRL